jgi:hypothetical protein
VVRARVSVAIGYAPGAALAIRAKEIRSYLKVKKLPLRL